jgi:RNA binding exosome subunit
VEGFYGRYVEVVFFEKRKEKKQPLFLRPIFKIFSRVGIEFREERMNGSTWLFLRINRSELWELAYSLVKEQDTIRPG